MDESLPQTVEIKHLSSHLSNGFNHCLSSILCGGQVSSQKMDGRDLRGVDLMTPTTNVKNAVKMTNDSWGHKTKSVDKR